MKQCRVCGELKELAAYRRRATSPDGRRSDCKSCHSAAEARRYAANPEAVKARTELWIAANIEKHRAYVRKHNQEHHVNSRRRALKQGATVETFTYTELLAHWAKLGLSDCVYCGAPYEHADHVIPLARGGEHSLDNLVPACAACNLSKGAKLLEEWLPTRK